MSNAVGPLTLLQAAEVAQWYEAMTPDLLRWIQARGHVSAREAEDIVQDTFIRVIQHAPQLAAFSASHRRGYVFTIAAHLSANGLRAWHRHGGTPLALGMYLDTYEDNGLTLCDPASTRNEWMAHAQPDTQPEQTTAARMTLRAVWDATPPDDRELLLMVAYGYSLDEMAAHLGMTKGSVRIRIWRMRRALLDVGGKLA